MKRELSFVVIATFLAVGCTGTPNETATTEDGGSAQVAQAATTTSTEVSRGLACELSGQDVMDGGPGMLDDESQLERGHPTLDQEINDWMSARFNPDWETRTDWHTLQIGHIEEAGSRARAFLVDADSETQLILTITLQPNGLWTTTATESCDPPAK